MTLSGSTILGQSGPENKGLLCIPQSTNITGTSPSDCLVLYQGHSLGGGLTAEVQSVFSTALVDWSMHTVNTIIQFSSHRWF